jgi:hypothetical protein
MEGLSTQRKREIVFPAGQKMTAFVQSIKQYINKEIDNQHWLIIRCRDVLF